MFGQVLVSSFLPSEEDGFRLLRIFRGWVESFENFSCYIYFSVLGLVLLFLKIFVMGSISRNHSLEDIICEYKFV